MQYNIATSVSVAAATGCFTVAVFCWGFARGPRHAHFRWAAIGALADAGYCLTDAVIGGSGTWVAGIVWAARMGLVLACAHSAAWMVFLASWAKIPLGRPARAIVGSNLVGIPLSVVPDLAILDGEVSERAIPALGITIHDPHVGPLATPIMLAVCVSHAFVLSLAVRARMASSRAGIILGALAALLVCVVVDWLSGSHVLMLPNLLGVGLAAIPLAIAVVAAGEAVDDARGLARRSAAIDAARGKLVESERLAALGEMASVLAHEVRAPLNVIYRALGGLGRPGREETENELFEVMEFEATRLRKLTSQMLDLVRPIELHYASHAVEHVTRRAAADAVRATTAAIDQVEYEADVADHFECDDVLIEEALKNLVMNALVAEDRRAPVRVSVRTDPETVRVEVVDDGRGVPVELRAKLFSPFFTTRAIGTGLGLAISRRIAEAHGGTLEYVAMPDRGACFVLRVPRRATGANGSSAARETFSSERTSRSGAR